MSVGVGDPLAFQAWPATPAGARWGGLEERRVGAGAGGDGHVMTKPGEHPGAVGGVGDQVDPPVGEPLGDEIDQVTGQIGFGALTSLDRQAGQHRQRHRPRTERQRHHDRGDHPVVPEPQLELPSRGAVVEPADPVHLLPAAAEQSVIDHDRDRCARRQQVSDDQLSHPQPELVGAPPGRGEEPVRPGVVPHPGQTRPAQHAAHRPSDRLGHQPAHQRGERLEGRRGETRPEHVQHA